MLVRVEVEYLRSIEGVTGFHEVDSALTIDAEYYYDIYAILIEPLY